MAHAEPVDDTKGAFHSNKNSGLNFRNFRMPNGTVFFTRPDLSRLIPAWAHFPPRFTRQNAKGLWWSGCPKCHIHNYFGRTLSWYLPTQTPFSCDERNLRTFLPGEYANWANCPTRNSEQTVHNFAENQILSFLWKIGSREQARTVADRFASAAIL